METTPYNPLDKIHLAESIGAALEARPLEPLPPARFLGAGIYALYYGGDFKLYAPISRSERPIYVGSALSARSRRGIGGLGDEAPTRAAIYGRLRDHARSIGGATNLKLD